MSTEVRPAPPPTAPRRWPSSRALGHSLLDGVRSVTTLGQVIAVVGVLAWLGAVALGWQELALLAAVCLVVLTLSILLSLGSVALSTQVRLSPERVVVGERAVGELQVRNDSGRRLLPLRVELPVGRGVAVFDVPGLPVGGTHEDVFVVPTSRRALIPVGPARAVRGDPLGLVKRSAGLDDRIDLYVHPRTVPLEPLGAGFLRDLEGQTTQQLSVSDLAFHTLREYVPGDDRRHVHWRTSARLGQLMVRQFLDTRRSHVLVLLDGALESYAGEAEFEDALSAAASIAVRLLRDGQTTTIVGGGQPLSVASPRSALDGYSAIEWGSKGSDLSTSITQSLRHAPDVSLALIATGSSLPTAAVRAAVMRFPPDVLVVLLRMDHGATPGLSEAGGLLTLTLSSLRDVSGLMRAAGQR